MFHSPQLQACINRFEAAKRIPLPADMPNNLLPITGVNWLAGKNQSQVNRIIAALPMNKAASLSMPNNPNFNTFNLFNELIL